MRCDGFVAFVKVNSTTSAVVEPFLSTRRARADAGGLSGFSSQEEAEAEEDESGNSGNSGQGAFSRKASLCGLPLSER
jgi:hypothetical protein